MTTPFRGGNCKRRDRGRQGSWPHHGPKPGTRLALDERSPANQCRRLPLVLGLYPDRFSNFEFFVSTNDALHGEPCHAVCSSVSNGQTPKPGERHATGGACSPCLLNGSASRLPTSRESLGRSGSKARLHDANFTTRTAIRSSQFGGSRSHLWISEDSCFSSQHQAAERLDLPGRMHCHAKVTKVNR